MHTPTPTLILTLIHPNPIFEAEKGTLHTRRYTVAFVFTHTSNGPIG